MGAHPSFAPDQTNEKVIRLVDEMMVASGFKHTGTVEFRTGNKIMTGFEMPGGRADAFVTVEGRRRGARLCVQFTGATGDDEFQPNVRAGISRLTVAIIDRFGEDYVATSPCHPGSQEPYWPSGNGS